MSALLLETSASLWAELLVHLRNQGAGVRESGAFLLGNKTPDSRVVTHYLPYEQLQTNALHDDYVTLTAESFASLWELCRSTGLSVVADVHTHRLGPSQSRSDRTNPMVALTGHIALIVPRFAQGKVRLQDLGFYVYQGSHCWTAHPGTDVPRIFRLHDDGGAK